VRKAPVVTAALVAAVLIFFLPGQSEARSRHRKGASRRAWTHSARPGASAGASRARAREATAGNLLSGGPARRASRPGTARNHRLIHQIGSEVVLDSLEVVTAEGYGPSLPNAASAEAHGTPAEAHAAPTEIQVTLAEEQNYPVPPCPSEDPVIEAHLHDEGVDAPEKEDAEDVVPRRDSSRIARLARRLGSLFRPKSATARVRPRDVDLSELLDQNLLIPVEGVDRERLRDSFLESRGQYARHLAIDIGALRGTPILATDSGEIVKLTRERRGGITIYQKDPSGRYLFFYCHLARYANGLSVGQEVSKGDVIGYVGATGHVIGGPHLHFSITRLPEDDDNLREGLAINPYLLFLAGVP
jgi:murein DD-endopeptidase MepM/ murein hydrolase activator NlpD